MGKYERVNFVKNCFYMQTLVRLDWFELEPLIYMSYTTSITERNGKNCVLELTTSMTNWRSGEKGRVEKKETKRDSSGTTRTVVVLLPLQLLRVQHYSAIGGRRRSTTMKSIMLDIGW